MIAMTKLALESSDYDFWKNLVQTNFRWLQSYIVPNLIIIAVIFSFFRDEHCNNWSLFRSRLQSYLVPIGKVVAIIIGLPLYRNDYSECKDLNRLKIDGTFFYAIKWNTKGWIDCSFSHKNCEHFEFSTWPSCAQESFNGGFFPYKRFHSLRWSPGKMI